MTCARTGSVDAVKALGAHIVLQGDSYDEAYAHSLKLARSHRLLHLQEWDA